MFSNLTGKQEDLARWMAREARDGVLPEEFWIYWMAEKAGGDLEGYEGDHSRTPEISKGALDALTNAGFVLSEPYFESYGESSRRVTITGSLFEAVDSDFGAPDISFVRQLTPLADVMNLDDELKGRVLPILGAGSADPKLWDSAVRTAGVILEERLRAVGGITDPTRVGRDLVNDVFGGGGSLANRFTHDSKRQGHRDLYAGVVGAFRNPYAHRLLDPTPEDGGAFIVFVNLLLKMLEDLRKDPHL